MLKSITVRNFALASSLSLEFGEKLNILSGETGAGKSILIDCIMLLTGGKYDKTSLRYGTESGFVEGAFSVDESNREAFSEYLGDGDEDVIVTRKFNAEGRNDIKINDRSVTLSTLKRLGASLLDVCGQNEHQSLSVVSNHIKTLDCFARKTIEEQLGKLDGLTKEYRSVKNELDEIGNADERERELDVCRYRLEELKKANVKDGEEEELVAKRKKLLSAERVRDGLSESLSALNYDEDGNVSELLARAIRSISSIAQFDERYGEWAERLRAAAVEADDVASEIEDESGSLDFSDDELDELERRLETVRSVTRKYGDASAVKRKIDELASRIDEIENADERYEKLSARRKKLVGEIYETSLELSNRRREAAKKLAETVEAELSQLGMAQSKFEVKFADFPEKDECESKISARGMDEVEFYLSPNPGQPLKPLVRIASGGELSRLMLALKVASSGEDDVPAVVFDEIDVGISGTVAREVAKKLARLSRSHQLLCVTHLAQIAAMADDHYFIDKYVEDGQTYTRVRLMDERERVGEVARLSGGRDITVQAESNAAEILEWCKNYKSTL